MVHACFTGDVTYGYSGRVATVPVPQTVMLDCGRQFSPSAAVPAGNTGGTPGSVAGGGVASINHARVDSGRPRLMAFNNVTNKNR
jgi:hypothetical protein